jgi:hypothetical protein
MLRGMQNLQEEKARKARKRLKRNQMAGKLEVLPAAPEPLQPRMLFTEYDLLRKSQQALGKVEANDELMRRLADGTMRVRLARGGRWFLDESLSGDELEKSEIPGEYLSEQERAQARDLGRRISNLMLRI